MFVPAGEIRVSQQLLDQAGPSIEEVQARIDQMTPEEYEAWVARLDDEEDA